MNYYTYKYLYTNICVNVYVAKHDENFNNKTLSSWGRHPSGQSALYSLDD